jgi:hypothetical protein
VILIRAAAFLILGAACVLAGLNRFTGVFRPKPSERRIARELDFSDPSWAERLAELYVPSCEKDFSLYAAFSYAGEKKSLTLVYSTRAGVEAIRTHYIKVLDNSAESGKNDEASLGVRGTAKGRDVRVMNYFSEVANLVRVDLQMDGEYAELIRQKIIRSFPQSAIDAAPEIAALASGQSRDGYVLYDNNLFSMGHADTPIFSRAYPYGGAGTELKERINALARRFTDPANARIGDGMAEIKHGGYLYMIRPLESGGETLVAVMVQRIPDTSV